jgi:membrane protease YdiL (CAAX protease family)
VLPAATRDRGHSAAGATADPKGNASSVPDSHASQDPQDPPFGYLPSEAARPGLTAEATAPGAAPRDAPAPPAPPPARVMPHPPGLGLALLQIVACSSYPTQILTMAALMLLGFRHVANPDDWSLVYVGTVLLIDSVLLVGLAIAFLRLHGERPTDVFLGMQPVAGEVVRGILLVPIVFLMVAVIALVVQRYAPWLHNDVNPFQTLIRAPNGILVVGALSIIVGGLREEVQRAFVLHRFTQIGTPVIGLIVFSVLFGLGHQVQGWDAVIMTAALGAIWGAVYLRRRSLVAPAVCHGAFDVIQVAALGLLT